MSRCVKMKSLPEDRFPQRRKTPSFSSTLLDSIYRSIDESNAQEQLVLSTMRKKQSSCTTNFKRNNSSVEDRTNMIEKWMEKQSSKKCSTLLFNSTSSSSESSCGGIFSSSEAEFGHRVRSKSSDFTLHRPNLIRTGVSARPERSEKVTNLDTQQTPKREGTKSRALKMYSDLKKAKQPISPGGRIASFLNSLFTSVNTKKAKLSSSEDMIISAPKLKSSTCSSASSFSRSCLSKTPSSRGQLSNGMKRSVRFYPVSVIVDEDCRPCGHKCLYEDDPSLMPLPIVRKVAESSTPSLKEELKNRAMVTNSRIEAALKDLHEDDDEDDDDDESYTSSDLFELDNLSAIGIGTYGEELPVYGTTVLKTNQAIANGLIM